MRERVKEAMSAVFELPASEIPDDASPESVEGWDSLGQIQLVLELEMAFGVRLPAEQIPELVTLGAIEEALRELGAA